MNEVIVAVQNLFQFHFGSIQTSNFEGVQKSDHMFQFHFGSIQTVGLGLIRQLA